MITAEHPHHLQFDMFSGEFVDNRTTKQRRQDRVATLPQQMEMFTAREVCQFGVNGKPHFPFAAGGSLLLEQEDPRTPEERDRDLMRAAEAQTHTLIDADASTEHLSNTDDEYFLFLSGLAQRLAFSLL